MGHENETERGGTQAAVTGDERAPERGGSRSRNYMKLGVAGHKNVMGGAGEKPGPKQEAGAEPHEGIYT